jgi:hypothetical protein
MDRPSRILKSVALAVVVILMMLAVPVAAANPTAPSPAAIGDPTHAVDTMRNIPAHGATDQGGTFRGTVKIVDFRNIDGQLTAIALLSGRVRDAQGELVGTVQNERVRLPLALGQATSCDILKLRLGPLDLDLLGLVVHLDRIVLDITAEPGPGNLLGNLLCAIAGLLDEGVGLNDVLVNLLRAIRQIVNGL